MSKHTPGPWSDVPYKHSIGICHGGGNGYSERIAECVYWEPKRVHQPDRSEAEANARLIAAAPELLEALKAVALDGFSDVLELRAAAWSKVRAAITKAEEQ